MFKKYFLVAIFFYSSKSIGQTYTYDNLNRITIATYPNSTQETFSYDANGNRINSTVTSATCPGTQTTFYAGTNAAENTYQWQMDNGNGFVNISNDYVHSGVTTPVLILKAAPTSWYGRNYRCAITGPSGTTYSQPSTLKFSLVWVGGKSTAWEEPQNWNCTGAIPDANTDVIINGNTINYPVVSFPAACKSLRLAQGTVLNILGNKFLEIGMPWTVTDIDGNKYPIVTICNKNWTARNLEVTRYRNGDVIPQVQDSAAWSNLTTGAWCYYQNNTANGTVYGKLYNWYAVNDPRGLAPMGWHIPTEAEWNSLADTCLGGSATAGDKIKSTGILENGTGLWQGSYNNSTNSSGFSGLPAGSRNPTQGFSNLGFAGIWWSASQTSAANSSFREADFMMPELSPGNFSKKLGISVRCVKD
jgi:uncharacterized protein (TIGR02145 family)